MAPITLITASRSSSAMPPPGSSMPSLPLDPDFSTPPLPKNRWQQSIYDFTHDGLTKPSLPFSRATSAHTSLAVSRSRFVLRLISAIASVALVASIAGVYVPFHATSHSQLLYAGHDLWPENINLKPTNTAIGTGSAAALLTLGSLIAGISPQIRHVSNMGDAVHGSVAFLGVIFGAVASAELKVARGPDTLWGWTCGHTGWNHPQVDFSGLCGDLEFAYASGWIVAVVEALILVNVVVGCVLVRNRTREMGGSGKRSLSF